MGKKATVNYEGLSSKKYEEVYLDYSKSKPPLTSKQKKVISDWVEREKSYLDEQDYFNQCQHCFGFLSKWKRKLVLRIICVKVKIDRRRKLENRFKISDMEILTAIEGLRYANCYSCYLSYNMGINLKVYFDDDSKCNWYYANTYYVSRNRYVDPDYLDGFYTIYWDIDEILKKKGYKQRVEAYGCSYLKVQQPNAYKIVLVRNCEKYFHPVEEQSSTSANKSLEKCQKFIGFEIFYDYNEEALRKLPDFNLQGEKIYYSGLYIENEQVICPNYIEPSNTFIELYTKIKSDLGLEILESQEDISNSI